MFLGPSGERNIVFGPSGERKTIIPWIPSTIIMIKKRIILEFHNRAE